VTTLKTVRGVELARVGVWHASSGPWECTREQLADAVRAAGDPAFRTPVLKAGHIDPRFNAVTAANDGEPALGRVTNLRLADGGDVLVGDYEGVPAWLADILPSAYPSRSVEMNLDVETVDGARYAGVLTAVALLGVTAPAVESLADVAGLYGADIAASGDRWTARTAVAAAALPEPAWWPPLPDLTAPMSTPGGSVTDTDTTRPDVAAAADLDGIRPAFTEWVSHHDDDPAWAPLEEAWICEVWTDAVIATDWEEGRYWRVTWTETGGVFTFGAPQRVTRTYVPVADTMAARATADMHRPLRWFRGRDDVSASSLKEQTPVADPTPAPQTPSGLRERLGLAADATDDAVLAAVDALKAKPAETIPTETKTVETPAPAVTVPDDISALVEQKVAAATAPLLDALKTVSGELADRKAAEKVARRDQVLAAAAADGKITPASLPTWQAQYDAAPDAIEAVLGATAPGTAMAVRASGVVGAEPVQGEAFTDADFAAIFGSNSKAGA